MDTLFGWPQAPDVSVLEMLGLLGGIPLVVIIISIAVLKGDQVVKASKHGPGPQPSDPVWEGGRALSIMGGAEDQLPVEAEARRRALTAPPSTPTSEAEAGGSSARW